MVTKSRHVWFPNGRSLCDRRARPQLLDIRTMSRAELERELDEQENAPACGSCLLLANYLRNQAAELLVGKHGIHPERPVEAWGQLAETTWAGVFNLLEFLDDPDKVDRETNFESVNLAVTPHLVQLRVEEEIRDNAEYREAVIEAWERCHNITGVGHGGSSGTEDS